jgi:DNA-binding NarL/FixJ family response regulator
VTDHPVLLVADDPLVRSGLSSLLPEGLAVVRAVPSDGDLAQVVANAGVVAVLWDAGDGIPPRSRLDVGVPVVLLVDAERRPAEALAAGAAGVLLRDLDAVRLSAALDAVRAGLTVVDTRLADRRTTATTHPDEGPLEPLTPREVEVLGLLAEGRSNREIALALEISVHTSKFHVDRILLKLEASSRTDAVVRGVRLGLLTL